MRARLRTYASKFETPSGDRITELVPPAAVNYFGAFGATVIPPGPIGTTTKTHTVTWFNIFGAGSPRMFTNLIADPPAGDDDCRAGLNITVQRKSAIQTKIVPLAGFWTDVVGPTASTMNAACALIKTEVELLKSNGSTLAGPGTNAHHDRVECGFLGCTTTGFQDATVTAAPTAPPNLSTTVSWSALGYFDVRYRVVWHISQPPGVVCTP